MDYALKTTQDSEKTLGSAARALAPLLADERTNLIIAVACVIVSSVVVMPERSTGVLF